ncbi:hypothetical protein [Rhizobium lusitanum]|uniref:Uncharacterized protein n=1 Tax=Rhizobium lusitanum TaxID=293958 RepID=A0A1C3VRN5_9HYPH|nr:hypothetical protein [Rhizobium lusitanum]SCB30164.1 hypothetical protein GA0061101_10670 [Rhizobium lusitanum]
MNLSILLTALNAFLAVIPSISSSTALNKVVAAILSFEPIITQFYAEVKPVIENIIAAVSANPSSTATQLAALKALDLTTDKAFDDAFTAYATNHPTAPLPAAG